MNSSPHPAARHRAEDLVHHPRHLRAYQPPVGVHRAAVSPSAPRRRRSVVVVLGAATAGVMGLGTATAWAGHSSVPEPGVATVQVARDTYQRSVSSGLGRADLGGAYTVSASPGVSSRVAGGAASVSGLAPRTAFHAQLLGAKASDTMVSVVLKVPDSAADPAGFYFGTDLRRQGDGSMYRAKVKIAANTVALRLGYEETTVDQVLSATGPLGTVRPGEQLVVQAEVIGSARPVLAMRAWRIGEPVPNWQLRYTAGGAVAIAGAGSTGTWAYQAAGGTTAGFAQSDLRVWSLGTGAAPAPGDAPSSPAPASSSAAQPRNRDRSSSAASSTSAAPRSPQRSTSAVPSRRPTPTPPAQSTSVAAPTSVVPTTSASTSTSAPVPPGSGPAPVLGAAPAGMSYPKVTLANTGADAMTAATGRRRSVHAGNLVLSPSSPAAHDLDVYGQVLFAPSASRWTATLSNVYVHGSRLPALSAPYTKNYESSVGLIQNSGASNASVHLDGVTAVPDYPDSRWDGLLGHDFSSDNWGLVIAHVTDGVGIQNAAAGTSPPINITLNRVFIDWLAFWAFSPGSPNRPQTTHNDDIQGFGGTNIRIGQGSWLGGFVSMPDGFVHSNGLVHNDPFGYAGNGAGYVPPGGHSVQGNSNANIQMNTTEGTWNGFALTDVYLDGGNFGINAAKGVHFANSAITRARFGRNQYKWPKQYAMFNTLPAGLVWTLGTILYDDGSPVTLL